MFTKNNKYIENIIITSKCEGMNLYVHKINRGHIK